MRLKDLQPNTDYATCDGNLVQVVEPISDKYYEGYAHTANGSRILAPGGGYKSEWTIFVETDPWAKCAKAQKPDNLGVLVEVFDYEPDGTKGKSLGKMTVKARDIGGTWGNYLVLHADVVQDRAESRLNKEHTKARAEELRERLDRFFKFPVGEVKRRYKGEKAEASTAESSTTYASCDNLRDNRWRNYVDQPDHTDELKVHAKNDEDVEWLFQVLEEGVKAVERKQKRAAAKVAKS